MKPGDTFRIGGVPIVVVSDSDYPHRAACEVCAFHKKCGQGWAGDSAVNAVEAWHRGNCIRYKHHYEVRL